MATFSYDTFLRPLTTGDKNIQIYDAIVVRYIIRPLSVSNSVSDGIYLKIYLKSGSIISVDFPSSADAILAVTKFQEQLAILGGVNSSTSTATSTSSSDTGFSSDLFLRPVAAGDTNIQIFDNSNKVRYTIYPFSVVSVSVASKAVQVNVKSSNIVTITFPSEDDAKLALIKLQTQIDLFKTKVPLFIDQDIKNYVDSKTSVLNTAIYSTHGPTQSLTIPAVMTADKQILYVSINGILIYDWTLIAATSSYSTLTINNLGYSLDTEDDIVVEYYTY